MGMSHPFYHAKSSAKRFGGVAEDYQEIHNWFDQTKAFVPDVRHRAILHSSFGIFLCEQVFGVTITRKSDGKEVPTRTIAEQHIQEDMGFIPTPEMWFRSFHMEGWMARGAKALSREVEASEQEVKV